MPTDCHSPESINLPFSELSSGGESTATTMIAVTSGYARVSKTDDESKNPDTQLMLLAEHGIRPDLVFSDVASGRTLKRPGWQEMMARVQGGTPSWWPSLTGSPGTSRMESVSKLS